MNLLCVLDFQRMEVMRDHEYLIEKIKTDKGLRAKSREIISSDDTFELREVLTPYGKANNPDSENTFLWGQPIDWLRIYRQPPSIELPSVSLIYWDSYVSIRVPIVSINEVNGWFSLFPTSSIRLSRRLTNLL